MNNEFRSGFVSILGKTNVGKSTLLNALIGTELAIVSPKPQTTRHHIKGILNLPEAQIVFSDTPGIFNPRKKIDQLMIKSAYSCINDVDLLLFVIEPIKKLSSAKHYLNDFDKNLLKKFSSTDCSKFLIINKTDQFPQENILSTIRLYNEAFPFSQTVPVSAKFRKGLDKLQDLIVDILPEGPRYFPEDMLTDRGEDFQFSELIRQQVFMLTQQEIPYSVGVIIEKIEEKETLVSIYAQILVEKDQHKRILVGAGGKMIREIGSRARKRIENIIGKKLYLNLIVKVKSGWSEDSNFLIRENLV